MKKFTILFALYFIGISIIKAQPIMYRTNGTYGSGIYSLDSLPNSNFVFAIRGGIYPNYHVIIRADSSGNILWQKNTLSSALEQAFVPEVVGSKNNIYYTAQLNTSNGTKFTITKLNSQANTLWVKDFQSNGSNFKNATTEDFNGGIIMGGGGCSGNNFLIRIDSSGNFVWKKQYLTTDMFGSAVQALQKTKDHHFVVASQKQTSQSKHSMLIYKVDTLGNIDWMKELTVDTLSSHIFWPTSIREDNLGNIYITSLITTPYPELQTLLKLDPNGNLVFFSQVIGADLEFNDVFFDNNNTPIVIGKGYFTRPNKLYGLTIKFDENSGGILDARKIINNETYPDSTICFRKAIKLNSNKTIIAGDYFECYVNIIDNSFMQTCISETLNLSVNN